MMFTFFSLPSEVWNQIYENLLDLPEPIKIEMTTNLSGGIRGLTEINTLNRHEMLGVCPAILVANKQIYHEANSILYSINRFKVSSDSSYMFDLDAFKPATYEPACMIIRSFLSHIGDQNSSFIRRICIDFPIFYEDDCTPNIVLQDASIEALELIREKCTNLVILETSLETSYAADMSIGFLGSPLAEAEVLLLLDTRFREISSLQEIIVNVYDKPPRLNLRDKIHGHGWTINKWDAKLDWWDHYDRRNND